MKRIKSAEIRQPEKLQEAAMLICTMFVWSETDEGYHYWSEVVERLNDLANSEILRRKEAFAKCEGCGREMKPGGGCTIKAIKGADGKWYNRIANNNERTCHDCGAGMGKIHHWGCDSERCPKCHGQLMAGDCDEECFHSGSGHIEVRK